MCVWGTMSIYRNWRLLCTSDRVSASVSVNSMGKMSGSLQVNNANMRSKTVEEKLHFWISIHPFIFLFSTQPISAFVGQMRGTPRRSHRFITGLTGGALPPQELYLLRNLMHFSAWTQSLNLHWASFTLNKVPDWNLVLSKGPGTFRRGRGVGG